MKLVTNLDEREGPRDECGVFGIYAPGHDVSRLAYFALYALQHRGQESAGIAAADVGGHIMTLRELGLVNQVFDEQKLRALGGDIAVGHVRYSTTGSNGWDNAQPGHRSDRRELALGHNGNLINAVELHAGLRELGVSFRSTSDSEIIAALLASHGAEHIEDAASDVLLRLQGAFSTVLMTKDTAPRLPRSRRPAPARPWPPRRQVLRGQRVLRAGHHRRRARARRGSRRADLGQCRPAALAPGRQGAREAFCVFEYIYFARPDSRMHGDVLQAARGRMGEILAREAPAPNADLVIPVPDSGAPAARATRAISGLPQDDGLIKNRYVGRTFIEPGQELRKHGLRMKFNPLPEIVGGKSIVVVDDSIVRGNTTRHLVQMLREAGAGEVHLRISRRRSSTPATTGSTCPRARR